MRNIVLVGIMSNFILFFPIFPYGETFHSLPQDGHHRSVCQQILKNLEPNYGLYIFQQTLIGLFIISFSPLS